MIWPLMCHAWNRSIERTLTVQPKTAAATRGIAVGLVDEKIFARF